MRGDRTPGPSRVNQCKGLNGCGRDVLPTPLGVKEHRAYHLDRLPATEGRIAGRIAERYVAWRDYAHELERLADDLRGEIAELEETRHELRVDIADREDYLEGLSADYTALLAEFNALRSENAR